MEDAVCCAVAVGTSSATKAVGDDDTDVVARSRKGKRRIALTSAGEEIREHVAQKLADLNPIRELSE